MLVIPELEYVIITPPRCGSTALRDAVLSKFPKAKSLYRHMEAVAIPYEYRHYERAGVIRNPYERMWSLFKYMAITESGTKDWRALQRLQTFRPFDEWLLYPGDVVFAAGSKYEPTDRYYDTVFTAPEPMKSQHLYLTGHGGDIEVHRMEDNTIYDKIGMEPEVANRTEPTSMPHIKKSTREILDARWHWDLSYYKTGE